MHQSNRRNSFIRGAHTKHPQSCEERKPAPPNEEQFNAPTAGGHAMNPIAVVLTSRGNSKKETGTDKITANSRSSSGKGQMLFERCLSCCRCCVESEFFCPRWLNEKLFEANNSQTKDVACDSWAEGCCDWFLRVPGALVLSRDERTYKSKLKTKNYR